MTNLITRCPKCATAFNVTDAHLNSANGAVRCGSCLNVFNGRENLTQPAPTAKTVASTASTTTTATTANTTNTTNTTNTANTATTAAAEDDFLIDNQVKQAKTFTSEPKITSARVREIIEKARQNAPQESEEPEEVDDDESWALKLLEEEGLNPSQLGLKEPSSYRKLESHIENHEQKTQAHPEEQSVIIDEPADNIKTSPIIDQQTNYFEDYSENTEKSSMPFEEAFIDTEIPSADIEQPSSASLTKTPEEPWAFIDEPATTTIDNAQGIDNLQDIDNAQENAEESSIAITANSAQEKTNNQPDAFDLETINSQDAQTPPEAQEPETVNPETVNPDSINAEYAASSNPLETDSRLLELDSRLLELDSKLLDKEPCAAELSEQSITPENQAEPTEPFEQAQTPTQAAIKAQEYANSKAQEPEPEVHIPEEDLAELKLELEAIKEPNYQSTGARNLVDAIEIDAVELQYTAKRPAWLSRLIWLVLACLGVAVLAGQIAWLKFNELSVKEPYRQYYGIACEHLGCTLPQLKNLDKIRTSNLLVRTHPTTQGALLVDVVIQNHADYEQPFPKLTLVFSDIKNKVVASRTFAPNEYLGGDLAGANLMPSQKAIHLSLELVDPGKGAVSYKITMSE